MTYLALRDDGELALRDAEAVAAALRKGEITLETWIKIEDEESDWQTVAELFPELAEGN